MAFSDACTIGAAVCELFRSICRCFGVRVATSGSAARSARICSIAASGVTAFVRLRTWFFISRGVYTLVGANAKLVGRRPVLVGIDPKLVGSFAIAVGHLANLVATLAMFVAWYS